ncbi:hypothetical protein B1R29_24565 [Pseudomonas aeruginosa]|nr:hypothetical protein B1R29_24565 [Pseudomonas aeruginosa]
MPGADNVAGVIRSGQPAFRSRACMACAGRAELAMQLRRRRLGHPSVIPRWEPPRRRRTDIDPSLR